MKQSLADLIEALGSDDGQKRKWARETLTLMGEPAVEELRGLLRSGSKRVRWEAAKSLVAVVDPASVEPFVALMMDGHSEVRWLAASGLIGLGPRSVTPVLELLSRDAGSQVHLDMAGRVLRGLSSDNEVLAGIVGPVADVLGHGDPGVVAANAARALSELEQIRRA